MQYAIADFFSVFCLVILPIHFSYSRDYTGLLLLALTLSITRTFLYFLSLSTRVLAFYSYSNIILAFLRAECTRSDQEHYSRVCLPLAVTTLAHTRILAYSNYSNTRLFVGLHSNCTVVKKDKNYPKSTRKYNEIDSKPVPFFVYPLSGVGCLYILRTSMFIVLLAIYNIFGVIQGLNIVQKDENYPENTNEYNEIDFKSVSFSEKNPSGVGCLYIVRTRCL